MKMRNAFIGLVFLIGAVGCISAKDFPLSITTCEYPHMEAIRTGDIKIPECIISYSTATLKELHRRFDSGSAGDVIELDFFTYLKRFSTESKHDWVLVPVYLWREFPHRHIYQLPDGRMAVNPPTGALLGWSQGILASSPTFKPMDAWDQSILSSATQLSPVFPDSKTAEQSYFAETRIFPIMTVLAVRIELVTANPWLPEALFIAFSEAKGRALETGTMPIPWDEEHRDETISLMKKNYWSYGVRNNPNTLNALYKYAHEQEVINNEINAKDVFASETLQLIDEKGAKN